jgi:hypothetical protein
MLDVALIRERFEALSPHLDERGRRLFAATEAAAAGYGGIAAVSRITGIAASTIGRGMKDLAAQTPLELGRVRRSGGGRKALVVKDRKLLDDLNGLVEPEARGDPMSPLRWTCKSLRRLAAELAALGHRVSHTVVGEFAEAAEVQPSGQPQDPRGRQPSRSRRPVRLYQHQGRRRPGRRPSGNLSRHQEKGTRRRLQECRTRVASPRRAGRGAGARLPDQGTGPGGPLWRLRSRQQCRLGERRRHP